MNLEIYIVCIILFLSLINIVKLIILFIATDLYHSYQFFSIKKDEVKDLNLSLAVVIPAHNEETVIYKTLESVFKNPNCE